MAMHDAARQSATRSAGAEQQSTRTMHNNTRVKSASDTPFGRPGKCRTVLTSEQAVEIYSYGRQSAKRSHPHLYRNSTAVALRFNVSPKTVRDIWNRQAWAKATIEFWNKGDHAVKRPPRPKKFPDLSKSSWHFLHTPRSSMPKTQSVPLCIPSMPSRIDDDGIAFQNERFWTWECRLPPLDCENDDPFRPIWGMSHDKVQ
mmetsp:Transcript_26833/g.70527  ORF Transcript_26833/g.70527 Transcript_26833/m.70527 type:complete len:201 (+) Transcript_26833:95-697(+)